MSLTCVQEEWLDQHPGVRAWAANRKFKHPTDRAHPYPPGSGPKGQTCGTCDKLCVSHGSSKNFYKCRVVAKHWTKGAATDIRLRDAACMSWEPATEKLEPVDAKSRSRGRFAQEAESVRLSF